MFLEIIDEVWSEVLWTILTETFSCSQEFASRYSGAEGHIIAIGVLTGISGRKNGANCCTTRAGILPSRNVSHSNSRPVFGAVT